MYAKKATLLLAIGLVCLCGVATAHVHNATEMEQAKASIEAKINSTVARHLNLTALEEEKEALIDRMEEKFNVTMNHTSILPTHNMTKMHVHRRLLHSPSSPVFTKISAAKAHVAEEKSELISKLHHGNSSPPVRRRDLLHAPSSPIFTKISAAKAHVAEEKSELISKLHHGNDGTPPAPVSVRK